MKSKIVRSGYCRAQVSGTHDPRACELDLPCIAAETIIGMAVCYRLATGAQPASNWEYLHSGVRQNLRISLSKTGAMILTSRFSLLSLL